jgi:hypothetical protein
VGCAKSVQASWLYSWMSPPRRPRRFTSRDEETVGRGRSWSIAIGGVSQIQRTIGPVRVVMIDEDLEHVLEVAAVGIRSQSRHSRRAVPTKRSAIAFAFARGPGC